MHTTSTGISSCLLSLIATLAMATDFYVAPEGNDAHPGTQAAPLATLAGARNAIRRMKEAGSLQEPVTVRLQGGVYYQTQEVLFEPEDSGTAACPITYTAAGNAPVVLHGGRRITGWQKHDERLWVASVPEVAAGQWRFRQLFVNGQQRVRARTPNEGFLRVAACPEGTPKTANYHKDCQSFQFRPGDIRAEWTNLTDVEVIVFHFWTDSHLPIQRVDVQTNLVTFAHKAGKVFTDDFTEDGARYIVENIFEGLDVPGEWYLNRKTGQLFYYPLPGEDLSKVEVVAPVAAGHLRLQGNPADRRYVEHLRFRNLSFAYSRFEFPPGDSNDRQGSATVTAAISLRGARSCAFEQCRLSNLGTFAFDVMAGCADNEFVGNEIGHIAAGGLRVNGGTDRDSPSERTRNNRITDNWLHHYGQDFPSAVGVLLMNTEGNVVAHNHIHHGGYTGVSVGWVWGYGRSVSQNNRVEFNHIHHIGGVLSDMGGIYTLGVSPGTVLRNNHIHDVDANHYGGWGIYHDEGSTHLLVENNVVHHTKFAGFNIHYAKEVTVRNNIFALGKLEQVSRGRNEPHKSVYFENNIVYWREGDLFSKNWKDEPYSFHFNPKDMKGNRTVTSTFDCDWNLYFSPTKKLDEITFNGATWSEWQKRGKDVHSEFADPLFTAPDEGDFTLKPNSPALMRGFQPIDLSHVGPRVKTGPQSGGVAGEPAGAQRAAFTVPAMWEYSAPLIAPEKREHDPSRAQKDPTVVFHDNKWHVFMTVKLQGRSAIEYCAFEDWQNADQSRRTILKISDSDYYCAPQVFFFTPHKKWYLIYQMGVPGADKMWVAYSTTSNITDPDSWTRARPILDGGKEDPRQEGGLDYWIICDEQRAYLFLTNLKGRMWRLWTNMQDFPRGFGHCELALEAKIFEASHTYRLKGQNKFLTVVEENGRRYYKAYLADRLDGAWTPVADTAEKPFAGWNNVRPAPGVEAWTDNISHGELIRDGCDQTLTVDPDKLQFLFQGMWDKDKSGRGYGQFQWRIGLLTPVATGSQ